MMRPWIPLLGLLAACTPQRGPASLPEHSPLGEARALAAAARAERSVPGLSLVVMRGDRVVLAEGFGTRTVDGADRVTPATVFQLGSISKQFLAALVLALVEDGRLSLDDPVARHLADFAHLPGDLRVRDLLGHTSGIREMFMLPAAQQAFGDLTRTVTHLRAIAREAPVDFAAGSRWSYSNTNYNILAFLVEQLTSMPYERALHERFFRPLGLTSLRHCTPLPADSLEAPGHGMREGRVRPAPPENMAFARGDGGLCGNAPDVARWMRLLATGRVVSPASYALMTTPVRLHDGSAADYGFGLSLVRPDGVPKVAHNGAMSGHSASAAYYPDSAVTVVVLTNRGNVRTESIERRVARRVLGLPEPRRVERALTAEERAGLAGRYDIGVFEIELAERDGRLWVVVPPPGASTPLVHVGNGTFVSATDPDAYYVIAERAAPGRPRLRLYMGAMHWYGLPVSP